MFVHILCVYTYAYMVHIYICISSFKCILGFSIDYANKREKFFS